MDPQSPQLTQGALSLASWIAADPSRSRCWLARELGTDRSVIRRWLSGTSVPRKPARQRIAWLSGGAVPPEAWTQPVEAQPVEAVAE